MEDKPFIDHSDLLSVALSKSSFGSTRLGGDTDICQPNKRDYRPEGEIQNKVFDCIKVNESNTQTCRIVLKLLVLLKQLINRLLPEDEL